MLRRSHRNEGRPRGQHFIGARHVRAIRSLDTDSWQCCAMMVTNKRKKKISRSPGKRRRSDESDGAQRFDANGARKSALERPNRRSRRERRTSYNTEPAGRAVGDARSGARPLTGAHGETARPSGLRRRERRSERSDGYGRRNRTRLDTRRRGGARRRPDVSRGQPRP